MAPLILVTLQAGRNFKNGKAITIKDIYGKIIGSTTQTNHTGIPIDLVLPNLSAGAYLVNLQQDYQSETVKFSKL